MHKSHLQYISKCIPFICIVPDGPPENIMEGFLGEGNVRISWVRPSGPVFGYQLFYRRVSPQLGEEMTENITNPNITSTTLFGLEADAVYNVSMLAHAHLPVRRSTSISFQLRGEWLPELAVAPAKKVGHIAVGILDVLLGSNLTACVGACKAFVSLVWFPFN